MSEPMFKTKAKTIHIHQDKNTLYDKDVKFTKNREEHIVLECNYLFLFSYLKFFFFKLRLNS